MLVTFSEQMLSFSDHICTLLTAPRMEKFDAAWKEKLEIFLTPRIDFWFIFFVICPKEEEKAVYRKK